MLRGEHEASRASSTQENAEQPRRLRAAMGELSENWGAEKLAGRQVAGRSTRAPTAGTKKAPNSEEGRRASERVGVKKSAGCRTALGR